MFDDSHIDRLISQYLEGTLGRDDLAKLELALLHDSLIADRFAEWCLLHRQIRELQTEDRLHMLMDECMAALPGPPIQMRSVRPAIKSDGSSGRSREEPKLRQPNVTGSRWRRAWWAIALLGAAVLVSWAVVNPLAEQDQLLVTTAKVLAVEEMRNAPGEPSSGPVASVTRLANPAWVAGTEELHLGRQLISGSHVRLQAGRVKITFDCGAEVGLEGPCDFEIRSQMTGVLRSGKITANVPRRAFAFAILCPGVDLVDLGTSFGVHVGASGQTQLHVFEGEVLCSRSAENDQFPREAIHVKANRALEFDSRGGNPNDIAMNEEQFSGLISLRRGVNAQPQRVVPDCLALWLAADVTVTTDDRGRVISWPDIIYGDNISAEDALQAEAEARPQLVQHAVNGLAAVRFDGNSDFLLTTPLETTDDQTVLFVCQFSQSAYDPNRIWGGQILNYDGPPSRYLSTTLEPGVLQIGEPLLAAEFQPTLLSGQVFAGFIGRATVEAGRVDAEPVGADVPIVVSYHYNYGNGVAELCINGRSYGTERAFAPQEITSRKIIGRHAWMQNFFHGDLAELLIYNKPLSAEELAEATTYLARKYSITLDAEAHSAGE